MNSFLNLFTKGIFLGIANIIPGVSGGTIAVVLRIFDMLIEAINNFFKNPTKYIKFLIPIMFGAGTGIILFSKILETALENFSLQTNVFFVGLVAGSIPLIYNQAKKFEVKPIYYLATLISFSIVVAMAIAKEPTSSEDTEILLNISWGIKIFLSSILAGASMIIPGISGSFVMVLLGIYNLILVSISGLIDIVIDALKMIVTGDFIAGIMYVIGSNQFLIICISAIGLLVGIVVVSRLIEFLLKRAFSLTYFTILGLIFGSIFSIFNSPETYASNPNYFEFPQAITIIAICSILFALGFFIAYKLGSSEE